MRVFQEEPKDIIHWFHLCDKEWKLAASIGGYDDIRIGHARLGPRSAQEFGRLRSVEFFEQARRRWRQAIFNLFRLLD